MVLVLVGCRAAAQPSATADITLVPTASGIGVASRTVPRSATPPASATSAQQVARPTIVAPTDTTPASEKTELSPTAAATATPDPAVAVVLGYLDARARADVNAVTSLACPAWRAQAVTEAISFRSMNARLVGLACAAAGSTGAFTLVGCTGKMITTYGTESREWDLSSFVYQTVPVDGQWKMCGYH